MARKDRLTDLTEIQVAIEEAIQHFVRKGFGRAANKPPPLGGRSLQSFSELERERANIAEQKAARAREQEATARKLFRASFAAAIVLALLTGFAIFGFWSARRATQDAVANESRALAALSRTAINGGLGTDGAELALAAWPRSTTDSRPQLEVTLQALAESLALGLTVLPRIAHDNSVHGASFSRDERRILSWSDDGTLRLWDAAWRGANLFEIACNHTPHIHDLTWLSKRYGVRISDQICQAPQRIPVPDWPKIELAPR